MQKFTYIDKPNLRNTMKKTVFIVLMAGMFGISACSGNKNGDSSKSSSSPKTKTEKPEAMVGLNIGNRAPELEYPSPNGEILKLSSLRGKMVLIDFWASWCPPCRRENPNLVKTYNDFKNKQFKNGDGFTVYSVSLDAEKNNWVSAIESDHLDWRYHVSDLKYWNSVPAAMYQVRGIPTNFLIDGDGIIVAKDLRGPQLGQTLGSMTD